MLTGPGYGARTLGGPSVNLASNWDPISVKFCGLRSVHKGLPNGLQSGMFMKLGRDGSFFGVTALICEQAIKRRGGHQEL